MSIVAIIVGVSYFLWQKRHDYFFQGEQPYDVEDESEVIQDEEFEIIDEEAERILVSQGELDVDDEAEVNEQKEEKKELDKLELNTEDHEYESPVVEAENCDNECEEFIDEDEFAYCEEICGFSEDDIDRRSEDCDELDKFERDACYKQQAVNEEDMNICKKIFDAVLEENCERRVLEEILE